VINAGIKKQSLVALAALVVVIAVIALYIYFIRLGYLVPEPRREMASGGVGQTVEVYRDSFGIPHIYGQSTEDAMFALGYSMAEDRLIQIEMMQRTAQGKLAAVLGPGLVEYDKNSRLSAYTSEELSGMIENMRDADRRAFLSMVAGVNHYVSEAQQNPSEKLPLDFKSLDIELKKYSPEDILAGTTSILRTFGSSGGTELMNQTFLQEMIKRHGEEAARLIFDDILPLTDPDAYAITLDANQAPDFGNRWAVNKDQQLLSTDAQLAAMNLQEREITSIGVQESMGLVRGASRTIVIGPERSATGNPLILQGTADGIEVHLSTPDFEFAGLAIPPMGLPVQGRNLNIGVVITTGERDTVDIFAVETDPEDKYRYRYKDEWRQMDVRTETIEVSGEDDVTVEIARTVHGPVVLRDDEKNMAYAKSWAMWMEEANIWASALNALQHETAEEYDEQLMREHASNNNFSYADKDGEFGFRHTGNLPIRAPGVDPRLPTRGDGSQDWLGFRSHSEQPSLKNPEKGYIHAWNNKPAPDTVYGDGARWGKHFRTHLPLELIEGKDKVSVDDLKKFNRTLSASFYSVNLSLTSPDFFAPFFEEAAATTDDARIRQAAELMADWSGIFEDTDGDGYYDHAGQLLFRTWLPIALETVFNDDIEDWWRKLDAAIYIPYQTSLLLRAMEGDAAGLPMQWDYLNGESRADVVQRSIAATLDALGETYQDANLENWREPLFWRYMQIEDARGGDRNVIQPRRATRYSGGATLLRYLPEAIPDNGAPMWLAIMEISPDKPYYMSAIPSGGQSWFINTSWKASPHINDQYELHNELKFKTVHLDKSTIISEHESHLTIKPAY